MTSPYASVNSYDAHGNLVAAAPTAAASPVVNETIAYDGADHATVINDGNTITTETLGPSGRVLRRQVVQVAGLVQTEDTTFSYSGPGDSPAYSWATPALGLPPLARTTNVVGPSGLLLVDSGVAGLATYPITNGHGDIVGTTDNLGLYTANPVTDEFGRGEPPPDRLGWLGNHQRYSTGAALHLVRMGVRLYDPNLGRFLQVDPVEGGCSNDYAYVHGDPINDTDLSGRLSRKQCRSVFGRLWKTINEKKGLYYRLTFRAKYADVNPGHVRALDSEQRRVQKILEEWDNGGCGGRNWPGGTAASIILATDLATMPDPGTTGDAVPSIGGVRQALSWWSWTSVASPDWSGAPVTK